MADSKKQKNNYRGLLKKALHALGVKDYTELSSEEKATYEKWYEVLTAEVTLETLTDFIQEQLAEHRDELTNAVIKNDHQKARVMAARIENYEAIISLVKGTEREKEALAEHLEKLVANPQDL